MAKKGSSKFVKAAAKKAKKAVARPDPVRELKKELEWVEKERDAWAAIAKVGLENLARDARVAGSKRDLAVWRLSKAQAALENAEPDQVGFFLEGHYDSRWTEELEDGGVRVDLTPPAVPTSPVDAEVEGK